MKFLCVCEGGNVRSVALSYVLKADHGQDAIACGWRSNGPEVLRVLVNWADAVVVMQDEFIQRLRDKIGEIDEKKLFILDVGSDIYGTPLHEGLQKYIKGVVGEWARRGLDPEHLPKKS